MATPNRSAQFTKLQKVLKKHYDPALPLADRSVLEHLLFAICLENSHYDKAEEVFARLQLYDDWNEIRVTSATELGEVMGGLGDAAGAAARVKGVLQGIYEQGLFDQKYNFDIEHLRKQNIGKATKELEKLSSVTPFARAYVTQAALGGHAIPLDSGALDALFVLDVITDKDREKQCVPGLERAIPKNKGPEFSSLLHQLGADFFHSPHSPRVRSLMLEINPDAKDRLPKRGKDTDGSPAAAKSSLPKSKKASKSRPAKAAHKSTPKKKTGAKSAAVKSTKGLTKRKPR